MKEVEYFKWFMPPPASQPRAKPYLTRYRMTRDEAKVAGALREEPTSREVRHIAETADEDLQLRRLSDTSAMQKPQL